MVKDRMQEALNSQVNWELYSAYLYLSMSAYFESTNLRGFAHWMRVQAQEEVGHGMRIYDHLVRRGGRVILSTIQAGPSEWESPLAAFQDAYEHEKKVTGLIDDLVSLAVSEGDYAANSFLQWFVNEQVEEESSVEEVVQKLRMISQAPSGLFMLDRELAQRVITPAPTEQTKE